MNRNRITNIDGAQVSSRGKWPLSMACDTPAQAIMLEHAGLTIIAGHEKAPYLFWARKGVFAAFWRSLVAHPFAAINLATLVIIPLSFAISFTSLACIVPAYGIIFASQKMVRRVRVQDAHRFEVLEQALQESPLKGRALSAARREGRRQALPALTSWLKERQVEGKPLSSPGTFAHHDEVHITSQECRVVTLTRGSRRLTLYRYSTRQFPEWGTLSPCCTALATVDRGRMICKGCASPILIPAIFAGPSLFPLGQLLREYFHLDPLAEAIAEADIRRGLGPTKAGGEHRDILAQSV